MFSKKSLYIFSLMVLALGLSANSCYSAEPAIAPVKSANLPINSADANAGKKVEATKTGNSLVSPSKPQSAENVKATQPKANSTQASSAPNSTEKNPNKSDFDFDLKMKAINSPVASRIPIFLAWDGPLFSSTFIYLILPSWLCDLTTPLKPVEVSNKKDKTELIVNVCGITINP